MSVVLVNTHALCDSLFFVSPLLASLQALFRNMRPKYRWIILVQMIACIVIAWVAYICLAHEPHVSGPIVGSCAKLSESSYCLSTMSRCLITYVNRPLLGSTTTSHGDRKIWISAGSGITENFLLVRATKHAKESRHREVCLSKRIVLFIVYVCCAEDIQVPFVFLLCNHAANNILQPTHVIYHGIQKNIWTLLKKIIDAIYTQRTKSSNLLHT